MNVSLQDGYNIGWKLGAYLTGQANVELVKTYVTERQRTASELIDFDRNWSKIFKSTEGGQNVNGNASFVRDQFVKAGRYTAGQAYKYGKSIIVWPARDTQLSDLSTSRDEKTSQLVVGMRCPSAQVVRYSDAKVCQLLNVLRSDCRWRVIVFDGDIQRDEVRQRLQAVGNSLAALVQDFNPQGADLDTFIEPLLVLKTSRTDIEPSQLPEIFQPITGTHRIRSEWGFFRVFLLCERLTLNRSAQSVCRRCQLQLWARPCI